MEYFLNAIGWVELIILFAIIMILFGGGQLPKLARGLGEAIREFRKATREADETAKEITNVFPQQQITQQHDDPLIIAAKNKGINVEEKTRLQIVEELAQKIKEESKNG